MAGYVCVIRSYMILCQYYQPGSTVVVVGVRSVHCCTAVAHSYVVTLCVLKMLGFGVQACVGAQGSRLLSDHNKLPGTPT
jgi:hypothetical protein